MGDQRAPSEKDIVRVDSITGIVNTDIPLDIGFYLVLKLKPTEELPIVKYFRVIGANREIDNEMGQSVDSVFRYKNELYILVPPLKPGRKYDFLLGKNIYGDTFRKVVKINFFQLNNEANSAAKEYKNLIESLTYFIGDSIKVKPLTPRTFEKFDSVFNKNTRELYLKYYKNIGANFNSSDTVNQFNFRVAENNFLTNKISLDEENKNSLKVMLDAINKLSSTDISRPYLKKIAEEARVLVNLLIMANHPENDSIARYVLLGKLPVNFEKFQRAAASDDLELRSKNLEVSKKAMEVLLEYSDYFNSLNPDSVLKTSQLYLLRDYFSNSNKDLGDIIASLKKYPSGNRILLQQWVSTSTIANSFVTRIQRRVVPDVGLVYFPFYYSSELRGVRPYFGVNIDLRPVNNDIRLRDLRKGVLTPWHYTSIMMGLTLGGSIEKEGEIDDLFGNTNLLLGLGIRITHSIRLSTGTMFFQKVDTNPLIDDKSFACVPFASISFDVRVQNIANSFAGVLLK